MIFPASSLVSIWIEDTGLKSEEILSSDDGTSRQETLVGYFVDDEPIIREIRVVGGKLNFPHPAQRKLLGDRSMTTIYRRSVSES